MDMWVVVMVVYGGYAGHMGEGYDGSGHVWLWWLWWWTYVWLWWWFRKRQDNMVINDGGMVQEEVNDDMEC